MCPLTLNPASLANWNDSQTAWTVWPLQTAISRIGNRLSPCTQYYQEWIPRLHVHTRYVESSSILQYSDRHITQPIANLLVSLATSSYTDCTPISSLVQPYANIWLKQQNSAHTQLCFVALSLLYYNHMHTCSVCAVGGEGRRGGCGMSEGVHSMPTTHVYKWRCSVTSNASSSSNLA